MGWTRRAALLGAGAVIGAAVTRYVGAQLPSMDGLAALPAPDANALNDASLLSPTPIFKHTILQDDPGEALLAALRAELKAAATEGRAVNIGAARHSMGGQAIPRDGHAITIDSGWLHGAACRRSGRGPGKRCRCAHGLVVVCPDRGGAG